MEGWVLHELRHSYLSMLAAEGVHPKVIQDLAGHACFSTTMDIYTHVNMDQKLCAVDAIESAMTSPRPDPDPAPRKPSFTIILGSKNQPAKIAEVAQG